MILLYYVYTNITQEGVVHVSAKAESYIEMVAVVRDEPFDLYTRSSPLPCRQSSAHHPTMRTCVKMIHKYIYRWKTAYIYVNCLPWSQTLSWVSWLVLQILSWRSNGSAQAPPLPHPLTWDSRCPLEGGHTHWAVPQCHTHSEDGGAYHLITTYAFLWAWNIQSVSNHWSKHIIR